jgi:hypothetical protein
MNCCSTGLAVSKIVHVNAPAQTLWDVLTDVEAYPNFVETIKSAIIKVPAKSVSYEPSSSTTVKNNRVQVGTNICEERCKKRHKNSTVTRVLVMRRTVTNISENPSTNEYSISFSSQFDDEYPRYSDLLCNTSTLSIIPSNKLVDSTDVSSDNGCCELVGSLALEVGGAGSTSISALCPILSMACCKRKIVSHAERHFEEELRNYGTEAERRYQQQKLVVPKIASSSAPK